MLTRRDIAVLRIPEAATKSDVNVLRRLANRESTTNVKARGGSAYVGDFVAQAEILRVRKGAAG